MGLIIEMILIFISSLFLSKVIFDLIHRRITTLSFLYIVYFIFYIAPLLLSYFNYPIFYKLSGYNDSFYNNNVSLISSIINLIIIMFFISIYKTKNLKLNFSTVRKSKLISVLSTVLLITTCLGLIFLIIKSPDPSIYLSYGKVIYDYDPVLREYHSIVAMLCRFIIFFSAVNFLFINKMKYSYLFYLILSIVLCWIGGKRSFVAYSLLIFIISIFLTSNIKPKNIFSIMVVSILGFSLFSNFYQNNLRDFKGSSKAEKIENIYIDYSRLQNERYVLNSLLNDHNVVPFTGASILYNFTFFIPRTIWNDKPYPYAVYYTNNFFNVDLDNRLAWGLTTGLIDELLANFYWFGIFLYLLIIKKIVDINDKRLSRFSGLVGILVSCLMIILHFAAYSYVFLLWLVLMYIEKRRVNEA